MDMLAWVWRRRSPTISGYTRGVRAVVKHVTDVEDVMQQAYDDDRGKFMDTLKSLDADPERQACGQELGRVLEAAVDTLPETYRTVFMLRDIEGLSTSETGLCLGLGEEEVKTRLHRARVMIRHAVTVRIGAAATVAFQFNAPRCDRVVAAVLARIQMVVHDRSRVVLRCMRCGGWFGVRPVHMDQSGRHLEFQVRG